MMGLIVVVGGLLAFVVGAAAVWVLVARDVGRALGEIERKGSLGAVGISTSAASWPMKSKNYSPGSAGFRHSGPGVNFPPILETA